MIDAALREARITRIQEMLDRRGEDGTIGSGRREALAWLNLLLLVAPVMFLASAVLLYPFAPVAPWVRAVLDVLALIVSVEAARQLDVRYPDLSGRLLQVRFLFLGAAVASLVIAFGRHYGAPTGLADLPGWHTRVNAQMAEEGAKPAPAVVEGTQWRLRSQDGRLPRVPLGEADRWCAALGKGWAVASLEQVKRLDPPPLLDQATSVWARADRVAIGAILATDPKAHGSTWTADGTREAARHAVLCWRDDKIEPGVVSK